MTPMRLDPIRVSSRLTRRTALGFSALAAVTVLNACASPNPILYTLATVPGAERRGTPKVIELRTIGLARYLERSQIVRSSEDFRLDVLSNEWWGEPLDTMLSRVLSQNLTQRLPGTTIFAENGAVTAIPDATLGINIQRMDQAKSGAVILIAQVSVKRVSSTARTITIQVTPAGPSTASLVAAMSEAVGQLADQIAGMLGGAA
jgi:uncharacterized lipoprotein YmbA